MARSREKSVPGATFWKWPIPWPGPKKGEPIWGENGPIPGENKAWGWIGGVWALNPPNVKAGIEGVIGGRLVRIGEKGPLFPFPKGRGGGMAIREGAPAFCRRRDGEVPEEVEEVGWVPEDEEPVVGSIDEEVVGPFSPDIVGGWRACRLGEGEPIGAWAVPGRLDKSRWSASPVPWNAE